MGESFYDAVDDLGPERTPKAPEVIETLADQWQKGGYDIRWLFRTITGHRAYQRRVRPTATPAGKTAFASNCPSRLRSDQIVEALSRGAGPAGGPGGRPDRRVESWSRRQTGTRRPGSRQEQAAERQEGRRGRRACIGRRAGQRPGQGHAPGRTADRCSTPSSASTPRSPTTRSWGRFPRPSS